MPLNLFYTMVQKSQKWPKSQIKGGVLPLGITIGLEIGLLTKITFWSLLKVPFKRDILMKTVWKNSVAKLV